MSVAPETGLAYGAALQYSGSPASLSLTAYQDEASFYATFTQENQLVFDLETEKYLDGKNWFLYAEPTYYKYYSLFWGIGPDAPDSAREDYSYDYGGITASLSKELGSHIYLGLYYNYFLYYITRTQYGGILYSGSVPGSGSGAESSPGLRLMIEQRDNRYTPSSGYYLDLRLALAAKIFGSSSDFYTFYGDYRQYFTLFPDNVIAFNIVYQSVGSGASFMAMPELGGMNLMRGYYEGRYIDNDYLTTQLEYRFPLFWEFRGAIFGCLGQVAQSPDSFSTGGIKASYGAGIRWNFFGLIDFPLRFDLAFAGLDTEFYFATMEAF